MVISGDIPTDLLTKTWRAVHLRKAEVGKEIAKQQESLHSLERWKRAWVLDSNADHTREAVDLEKG